MADSAALGGANSMARVETDEVPIVRICGVPEHFNEPIKKAIAEGYFQRHHVKVTFETVPGGTGAMLKAVKSGKVDVAVALTEGIVANIAQDKDRTLCIAGGYVGSPLVWGVMAGGAGAAGAASLPDAAPAVPIGVSRMGSGSHIMSFVLAERAGWDASALGFSICKDFVGLRRAVNEHRASLFLWETAMCQPFVSAGELARLSVVTTPWPSFMLCTRRDWLSGEAGAARQATLRATTAALREACADFVATPHRTVRDIAAAYLLSLADAGRWLRNVAYAADDGVSAAALQLTIDTLRRVGVVDPDASISPSDLVHPSLVRLVAHPDGAEAGLAASAGEPAPSADPTDPNMGSGTDGFDFAGVDVLRAPAFDPLAAAAAGGAASDSPQARPVQACGRQFETKGEYDRFVAAKEAARERVEAHLAAWGGVPAQATR